MTTYTKSVVRITPLRVIKTDLWRDVVELLVEYADGDSSNILLTLPVLKRRGVEAKKGDTLAVRHNVVIDIHDQEEATRADVLMRMIGFRNASESLQ